MLYQLAIDGDPNLATAARTTAMGLPDTLLAGALANPALDPRVLDLFAQLVGDNPKVFEALVANPHVADETIAYLAANGGAREVDRIAKNEQRLLRHPADHRGDVPEQARADVDGRSRRRARGAQQRPRARPGRLGRDRARAPGPPAAARDRRRGRRAVRRGARGRRDDTALRVGDAEKVLPEQTDDKPHEEDEEIPFDKLSVPGKIRARAARQRVSTAARRSATRSGWSRWPRSRAPGVTEFEAARYASNPGLAEDVIKYIAQKREWTKLYGIKYSLCRNPKTPVTESMRLIPFLREKDLPGDREEQGRAVGGGRAGAQADGAAHRTGAKK